MNWKKIEWEIWASKGYKDNILENISKNRHSEKDIIIIKSQTKYVYSNKIFTTREIL